MVESMKPGSVIVDLAAERGGNCELTQPGKTVDHNGVSIAGPLNLAGEVPVNASSLYAKNLLAFLETMIDKKDKALKVNWDDEIVKGTLVAKDGRIVHPSLQPREREMTTRSQHARPTCADRSPSPLRGGARGGGKPHGCRSRLHPTPNPSPSRGGESGRRTRLRESPPHALQRCSATPGPRRRRRRT